MTFSHTFTQFTALMIVDIVGAVHVLVFAMIVFHELFANGCVVSDVVISGSANAFIGI